MSADKKGILITPDSIRKGMKYFIVVLLLLVPTVLNLLTQRELRQVRRELDEVKKSHNELSTLFNDYKDVVSTFYQEYQDTGMLTVEVLGQTVTRLEDAIEVYDSNVDIYNNRIDDFETRIGNLEDAVAEVVRYLSQ